MPSAIDPDAIPGKDINPDLIESNARTVGTVAASVRDNGSAVHTKWQGMAGVYSAPEAGTLLGLMHPVSQQATQTGDNLDAVSAALVRFAADVRPIKAELDSLRAQARSFVNFIDGGVRVQELNPAWVSTQSYYGTSYSGYTSYGTSTSLGGSAANPPKYRYVTKEWHEVQQHVDRNNELIAAVNAQQVALWDAERTCANAIRALYGAAPLRAFQSENDAFGYGLDEIPEGTEMPWGAPVERSEGCGEATAKFVFKDFLWEGIAVGGVWGTVQGLGTLVLGYNPETGAWFSGDAYGAAWGNLGLLAMSGLMNSVAFGPIFWADQGMEAFGGGGFLPDGVREFKQKADEAALNTGKALIAWDKWEDDPGTALGESVFNVGTALIPVGGAAVAGVKTASTAASVLAKTARVVDLVDPAAWAFNGATRLGAAGLGSLDNLLGRMDLAATKFDVPHIEVYTAMDSASALRALDDWGVDMAQVTARVDDGIPVLDFPGGRVELPSGSFDAGGGIRAADGGADASITAPVREPELVAAGGVRGETASGPVNSIVDEAPVRTETGGSGETTVMRESGGSGESTIARDPDTATGGGNGSGDGDGAGTDGAGGNGAVADEGTPSTPDDGARDDASSPGPEGSSSPSASVSDSIASRTDPMHNGDPGVPGEWERVADDPITPKDVHYGEPMSQHGHTTIPADPGTGRSGFDYVQDPAAPYGRHPDGAPLTAAEYDARYVTAAHNWDNYPPNAGAVRGTRIAYSDVDAFVRDYGAYLDRVGEPTGKYLGLRPDGVPANFESRGLPISSLKEQIHTYELTGFLPDEWRIEISEIAPAFGREGGGIQVLVKNDSGSVVRVSDLIKAGVVT